LVTPALPRRLLLAGTAGLLVPLAGSPSRAQSTGAADQELTDWIVIAPDGEITLGLSQPEVGRRAPTPPCRRSWPTSSMPTGSA
jgi:hypothetical protein